MKTTKGKFSMPKSKKPVKYYVIANSSYGLYYGEVLKHDQKEKTVTVKNCRHIARWYGGTGGITSLAAWGPKGESRIGAPCSATLTSVVNMFECTPEAVTAFAAMVPVK